MNQQLQFLRLIVQKMEIQTEACEYNEVDGDREVDMCSDPTPLNRVHQM